LHPRTYTGYECENCNQIDRKELAICPHCGFPKSGSEEEKQIFYDNLEFVRRQLSSHKEDIFQAKLSLWIIALLNFLFAFVFYISYYEMNDANLVLVINLLSALVFLLLGFVANEKPFIALLCGVLLYVALIIFRMVDEQPNELLNIFCREIFVVWLFKGLNGARVVEDLQKEIARRQPK
jgi:membrane-associated HD superfamily phosphohydrolase